MLISKKRQRVPKGKTSSQTPAFHEFDWNRMADVYVQTLLNKKVRLQISLLVACLLFLPFFFITCPNPRK